MITVMRNGLFREAALEANRQTLYGSCLASFGIRACTLAIVVFVTIGVIAAYACTQTYTKKEHVTGTVVAPNGTVRLFAPKAGVVTKLYMSEGGIVQKGDPLFEVLLTLSPEE